MDERSKLDTEEREKVETGEPDFQAHKLPPPRAEVDATEDGEEPDFEAHKYDPPGKAEGI